MTEIIEAMNCAESANEKTQLILSKYKEQQKNNWKQSHTYLSQDPDICWLCPKRWDTATFPSSEKKVCISDRSDPNSARVL